MYIVPTPTYNLQLQERMEENGSSGNSIPTVDLSLFFHQGSSTNGGQKRAVAAEIITSACRTTGFFRITNHGIPQSLMKLAIQHSKEFFGMPDEEKLKSKPAEPSAACPLPPAGYHSKLDSSPEKFEFLFIASPSLGFNVYPLNPPEYRCILEECFASFSSTTLVIGELLNECLGLPPNFLRDCNKERSRDFMLVLRYFPEGSDSDNVGLEPHQDGSCFTLLFQDEVRGLQVLRDGDWIPIEPIEGSIIVIIGEMIQVLTNNKFKGAKHRVMRNERDRYSFSFFYTMSGNQLVEPLPQFTKEINERPSYHGFLYKEYQQNRMKSRTHPTSRQRPVITISHYAIT